MEPEAAGLAIVLAGLFCFIVGWQISRMLIKGHVWEVVKEETQIRIQDLEFDNSYLKKCVKILTIQKDIAINEAKEALDERNEAMRLLADNISDGE